MYKAIIIDDEPLARALLMEMLSKHDNVVILGECNDGYEGIKAIQELQPDVIFLDIQMPKITGIEMLELLPTPPKVIFTTAYDAYAIKAFEVNAIDYLLKPYAQERLDQAIQKLSGSSIKDEQVQNAKHLLTPESMHRVVVRDQQTIKIIPIDDIYFVEAAADYAKITIKDKYYLKHGTMQRFEEQLPAEKFMRVHRSFLINITHLNRVELYEKGAGHCAIMNNNAVIPISKSGYQKIKEYLYR